MYDIVVEFGIHMKLARDLYLHVNENYSRVRVGKHWSDMFHIRNGLKQGDALSPLLFNFTLKCTIRRVQVNQDGFKLNGKHQLLVYVNRVNILGGSIRAIKENILTKYLN